MIIDALPLNFCSKACHIDCALSSCCSRTRISSFIACCRMLTIFFSALNSTCSASVRLAMVFNIFNPSTGGTYFLSIFIQHSRWFACTQFLNLPDHPEYSSKLINLGGFCIVPSSFSIFTF
ncbi:hypothetical protein HanRHA438_Chr17g0819111 [Helianthus annuus]|nr:hypothetical protein HanRHA438_Chr17g0819111 [Helianthus annuus]